MAPNKEVDPEEVLRRKFRAKCLFRRLVRLVLANRYWLVEAIDEYAGVDNVKRRVEQAVRAKQAKRLLHIKDKALLNKFAQDRTTQEQAYLFRKLGGLKCFKKYPHDVRRKLSAVTYFKYYGPNRVIVRQNQEAEAMYFIVEGDVSVSQMFYDELLRQNMSVEIRTMTAGDIFGEVSLLHNTPRTATITTKGHCEMLTLTKEDFKRVLQVSVQRQWDEVRQAMASFTYFNGLDVVSKREGCIVAKMKSYAVNETLLGDGEGVANYVYFVLSGRCQMIESLEVAVATHLGREHYKLYDPYTVPTEEIEENLEQKWFAAYNKKTGISTSSRVKSEMLDDGTKLHGVLKSSRSQKRESDSKQKRDQSLEAGPSRNTIRGFESNLLLHPIHMRSSSTRFSDTITISETPINEVAPAPAPKSLNLRTYFMQVVIFNPGSTFGFGENMRDRRIVALTPVSCMLMPMVWLLQRNTADIWTRVQHYLEKKIPKKKDLFKKFVEERRWQEFREQVVSDVVARSNAVNFTTVHDVPYSIRMEEMLDI